MKNWYRIVELVLLTVIAATLIIGQYFTVEDVEPNAHEGVVNLVHWSKTLGGNGHWYGVIDSALLWDEALEAAQNSVLGHQPGYLATITSYAENEFIRDRVITQTDQPSFIDAFWLGGYLDDGRWQWKTGEPFVFENWSLYEPNNLHDETALSLWGPDSWGERHRPGQWNNLLPDSMINQSHQIWSIVEWGVPDMSAKAEPFDTLIHLLQWQIKDGGNGHWYGIIALDLYHEEASPLAASFERDCVKGHLASVTSAEENEFILNQVIGDFSQPCKIDEYWLGATYSAADWDWSDGSKWKYEHWSIGEPNNIGIETSLGMWGPTANGRQRVPGFWNNCLPDGDMNQLAHFFSIIEFDTP